MCVSFYSLSLLLVRDPVILRVQQIVDDTFHGLPMCEVQFGGKLSTLISGESDVGSGRDSAVIDTADEGSVWYVYRLVIVCQYA